MIIHSPVISGSLTFADGATFTLPDNGIYSGSFSGSLQVHKVQSDLIPDVSGAYDLGSEAYPFQDLWLTGNTINIGGIGIGVGNALSGGPGLNIKNKSTNNPVEIAAKSITIGGLLGGVGTKSFKLNSNGNVELQDESGSIDTIEVKEIVLKDTSGNGKNTKIKNDGGKFTTQEVNDSGSVTSLDSEGSLSGSFTGSVLDLVATGDATFNDAVTVSGLSSLDGGIDVDGLFTVSAINGNVVAGNVSGSLILGNSSVIAPSGSFAEGLSAGNTTITGTVDATGLASLDGGIDVDGAFTVADSSGNVVTTGTITVPEGNLTIGSTAVDATAAELNLLDGSTAGTVTNSKAVVYGSAGEVNATKLQVGGVDITATPAELNLLDGVTATTAELNILDGVTATATEINALDGITVNATKLNYLTDMTGNVKSYVDTAVAGVVNSAPAALDTLNELAAALGNDANFATTTATSIGEKLAKSSNLSDLTNAATALTNLGLSATAAEINVLDGITASTTELNYVDGVTSNIQTQLNNLAGTDIGVTLTGAVTGTGTITNLGSVSISTTATSDPTLTISGDASGTATFTNLGNATLSLTIADDSHNHVISNIDGLQAALDAKQATISGGTGVTVSSNTVSIGQAVATNSNVTFATVSATGDIVAYASSDERLKDNIEVISNPIEKVQQLKGVTWDWNDNADELQKSLPNVGVIAQDVEKVLPQLVKDRDNGYKGVDYDKIVGLLIEAIKDQQTQIDELKSKLS